MALPSSSGDLVVYKRGDDGESPKFKKNNNTALSSKTFRDELREQIN
jgi:hypothetical protein